MGDGDKRGGREMGPELARYTGVHHLHPREAAEVGIFWLEARIASLQTIGANSW